MKAEAYEMLAARQGTYWWHRARRRLCLGLLRKYGIAHEPRWLDLGCGPGGNLIMLDDLSPSLVVGVDISPHAHSLARQAAPRARIVGADISRPLPFADNAFDLVTIFNVLYHSWVHSEVAVLSASLGILRAGGLLLITEPAFSILTREMDEIGMSRRRYRRQEIARMCAESGFDILYCGYITSFGFPLLFGMNVLREFLARRAEGKAEPTPDMKPLPALLDNLMYGLARAEGWTIERGVRIPFGTTLICIARKP